MTTDKPDIFDRIMSLKIFKWANPFYTKYKEVLMYLLFGDKRPSRKMRRQLHHGRRVIGLRPEVGCSAAALPQRMAETSFYLESCGFPIYQNSKVDYYALADEAYPHLLVTTGLHDSQVQYWEPAKWVAKLRALKTDDNLLLLCTDMDSGHGGKSGRFKSYEGVALEFAFLIGLAQGTLPGQAEV